MFEPALGQYMGKDTVVGCLPFGAEVNSKPLLFAPAMAVVAALPPQHPLRPVRPPPAMAVVVAALPPQHPLRSVRPRMLRHLAARFRIWFQVSWQRGFFGRNFGGSLLGMVLFGGISLG